MKILLITVGLQHDAFRRISTITIKINEDNMIKLLKKTHHTLDIKLNVIFEYCRDDDLKS